MLFKKKHKPDANPGRRTLQSADMPKNAQVFSYHAVARPTNPETGIEQGGEQEANSRYARLHSKRTKIVTIGALVAILVVVLINLPLSSSPQTVVEGRGAQAALLQATSVYQGAAQEELAASILSKTKATIDTQKISEAMRKQFPELAQVVVSVPLVGSTPTIHLVPAVPAVLLKSKNGEQFVIDTTGRAIVSTTQLPRAASLKLPVVTDESPLVISQGSAALPSTTITYITEVVGQLQAKKLAIQSLTLPAATSELDVRLIGAPYAVKFNLHSDARAGAGTYLAVKQQLERDHVTPGNYVDVRVDERAYYK